MKKITILALHLSTGGAENVISNISNMLSKNYDVTIVSIYKLGNAPAFKINDKVKIEYLMENLAPNKDDLYAAIKSKNIIKMIKQIAVSTKILFLRRHLMIKKIKSLNSEVIISSRLLFNTWLGKYAQKGTVKIAQEHNYHNNQKKYIRKVLKSLKNIDYFMPVSEELTQFYSEKIKGKTKCVYIPNAIDEFPAIVSDLSEKNLISVGRLSKEKGFEDLIDVFYKVSNKVENWKLNLIGDGEQLLSIKNKIKEYGLEDRVILYGFLPKNKLNELYKKSSVYVMTSFTESFGLVLVEAESYGIPLIAFDSANGARQIIKNDINGYLIQGRNKENMAEKIIELTMNYELRKKFGKNGRVFSEEYKITNISKKWDEFIEKI